MTLEGGFWAGMTTRRVTTKTKIVSEWSPFARSHSHPVYQTNISFLSSLKDLGSSQMDTLRRAHVQCAALFVFRASQTASTVSTVNIMSLLQGSDVVWKTWGNVESCLDLLQSGNRVKETLYVGGIL